MNKHFLKNIRDKMPESMKYLAAPIFRNKLIKNNEYCRYIKLLSNRDRLSEKEIKEYQFNELKKILNYSYNFVPYYTQLFDNIGFRADKIKVAEEIQILPFLTKELIRSNFDQLISTQKVSGGHYIATTGGSTGEPLKVLLDYNCVFKENAFVNHFRKKLGYETSDRLVTFRGIEFGDKLWKYNPMQNELIFSPFKLSNKTLSAYVNQINKFKPNYLNGYLSSLSYFAKLLSENNLKLEYPVEGIFLISENIEKEQREFLEDFFQAKSSTFYGHSERCIIAEEMYPNEYNFDPYYGYTEILSSDNISFEIVGTGFLNLTMPLIRYKTNDQCTITTNGTITIAGRWDVKEYLLGINEEKVFHSAFNFHSEIFKNVMNYQFIQNHKGKVDLMLVVNLNFKMAEIELIKKEIDKKTKGVIDFNIKTTDQLILSNRGKFKKFISEIDQK